MIEEVQKNNIYWEYKSFVVLYIFITIHFDKF